MCHKHYKSHSVTSPDGNLATIFLFPFYILSHDTPIECPTVHVRFVNFIMGLESLTYFYFPSLHSFKHLQLMTEKWLYWLQTRIQLLLYTSNCVWTQLTLKIQEICKTGTISGTRSIINAVHIGMWMVDDSDWNDLILHSNLKKWQLHLQEETGNVKKHQTTKSKITTKYLESTGVTAWHYLTI